MRYCVFAEPERKEYPICILTTSLNREDMQKVYIDEFGLAPEDFVAVTLHQAEGKKKTPMAEMRQYITEELIPVFCQCRTQYVICTDSEYYKALTKETKAESNLGYVTDTEYGIKVIYVPSHRQVFYDPVKIKAKIALGIEAMISHATGTYSDPGQNIIKFEEYPQTNEEIEQWLIKLLEMEKPLAIDIEAFSLKHNTAGIGTITFCWNKHEGIAFPVDYKPIEGAVKAPFGENVRNEPVRAMLKEFFIQYLQKAVYHNIAYDAYVLIYQLFMTDILDTEGLLKGMSILLRNWDDTKLISYLATNSCAGNKLSLKDQAQAYAGDYAQENIKDIRKIPLDKLLRYNLIDGLSTWYVHEKHYQTMVDDLQLPVYEDLFKPAILDIVQMQLTGMPLNMKRVKEVKKVLQKDCDVSIAKMTALPLVQKFTYELAERVTHKLNAKWKQKRMTVAEVMASDNPAMKKSITFNPNSDQQLQRLLFDDLGLPVLTLTDSKQPGTDGDTLAALKNHTQDPEILKFLAALADFKDVIIILTTFIAAMERSALGPDGWHYMFGNFNLGGTVSGRLSSSDPNLQNIPAKSRYAKLIKSCFQAPPGWIFAGLDFASLEDRISALTTKDPEKLKVYTDGYDGHCLRAYAYFGDQMTGIENTVASINSIKKKFDHLRDASKAPTFLLTYGGTFRGLMKNCGFPQDKSLLIEKRYHDLYKVSDAWVDAKLEQATKDGYVTAAFGLRVRTPLLHQVIRKTRKTPYEAEAEGRTAGNALGQSWCLLNSRAGSEFMGKVRESEYRLDIRPCAQIHDAQYFLIREDISALAYTNEHLVEAVYWQNDPAIAHPDVKLGGELSIFHPSWCEEIVIPNGAKEEGILEILQAA